MSLQLLILIGVGVILIAVLIRLYPMIYIGLARLIFGKYSSRYFAVYKRTTKQSPYPYCIKDDFINYIAGFYNKKPSIQVFDSPFEITFLDTNFGSSFKSVRKNYKKPFCINSNRLNQFDLKVLGYKDALFTVEMKKYYFFVDGSFFLGQLSFKNPEKDSIDKIIGVIRKKYLPDQKPESDRFIINGKNETYLYCHYNGFHLSISYISRAREDISKKIDDYWGESTSLELGRQSSLEEELMEKL